jgi:16S rRNA (guanine527-N7)-methyltransferase
VKPATFEWLDSLRGDERHLEMSEAGMGRLVRYAQWLAEEAVPAGLLSPAEGSRLWDRHVEDSLSFLAGWPGAAPERLLDVGSGAGLPGIPLAIALPSTEVTLLDRSEKRVHFLRRAVRILGLMNASVLLGEAKDQSGWEALTMRAVRPPRTAVPTASRLLRDGGTGVIGLARRRDADPSWRNLGHEILRVPVLDPAGWLLIIRKRGR